MLISCILVMMRFNDKYEYWVEYKSSYIQNETLRITGNCYNTFGMKKVNVKQSQILQYRFVIFIYFLYIAATSYFLLTANIMTFYTLKKMKDLVMLYRQILLTYLNQTHKCPYTIIILIANLKFSWNIIIINWLNLHINYYLSLPNIVYRNFFLNFKT